MISHQWKNGSLGPQSESSIVMLLHPNYVFLNKTCFSQFVRCWELYMPQNVYLRTMPPAILESVKVYSDENFSHNPVVYSSFNIIQTHITWLLSMWRSSRLTQFHPSSQG